MPLIKDDLTKEQKEFLKTLFFHIENFKMQTKGYIIDKNTINTLKKYIENNIYYIAKNFKEEKICQISEDGVVHNNNGKIILYSTYFTLDNDNKNRHRLYYLDHNDEPLIYFCQGKLLNSYEASTLNAIHLDDFEDYIKNAKENNNKIIKNYIENLEKYTKNKNLSKATLNSTRQILEFMKKYVDKDVFKSYFHEDEECEKRYINDKQENKINFSDKNGTIHNIFFNQNDNNNWYLCKGNEVGYINSSKKNEYNLRRIFFEQFIKTQKLGNEEIIKNYITYLNKVTNEKNLPDEQIEIIKEILDSVKEYDDPNEFHEFIEDTSCNLKYPNDPNIYGTNATLNHLIYFADKNGIRHNIYYNDEEFYKCIGNETVLQNYNNNFSSNHIPSVKNKGNSKNKDSSKQPKTRMKTHFKIPIKEITNEEFQRRSAEFNKAPKNEFENILETHINNLETSNLNSSIIPVLIKFLKENKDYLVDNYAEDNECKFIDHDNYKNITQTDNAPVPEFKLSYKDDDGNDHWLYYNDGSIYFCQGEPKNVNDNDVSYTMFSMIDMKYVEKNNNNPASNVSTSTNFEINSTIITDQFRIAVNSTNNKPRIEPASTNGNQLNNNSALILGLCSGGIFLLLIFAFCLCYKYCKKKKPSTKIDQQNTKELIPLATGV